MAQKFIVQLEDDIDGGDASETVTFGLDGVAYEIDLSEKNAAALREAVGSWTEHARRTGGRRSRGRSSASSTRQDLNEVRVWGRENGYAVSDRGRVSREVQDAYDKAH